MTKITPLQVDIRLADKNSFVDLILLQWWSTPPTEHKWRNVDRSELEFKRLVLARLHDWLSKNDRKSRPVFIVAPENSIPHELVDEIDGLMRATSNCVFIGGLVPLTSREYSDYRVQFRKPLIEDDGLLVNTVGLWIRPYGNNDVTHYLQVKRHLIPAEELNFTKGEEVWLFTNPHSRGLTFFSSICADFTAKEKVEDLLSAFSSAQSCSVDLGFVVMMSPHRDAKQFAEAATAYFSRPNQDKLKTDLSALVYLNNPSRGPERRDFGASEVAFRYLEVSPKTEIVKPTFSFGDSYGHYRALLRDNEPSIYYLRWQPLRLYDGGPGSDDPQVFELAQHLSLRECPKIIQFRNLPPVRHWLGSVWREAAEASVAFARNNFANGDASQALDDWPALWRQAVAWWMQRFGDDDVVAVKTLRIFDDARFVPPTNSPREPTKWELQFAVATTRLLEAFLILILMSGLSATLADQEAEEHLSVGGWGIAFVYARDDKTFAAAWRAFRDHAQLAKTRHSRLLTVVVASRGPQWHSCGPQERDITLAAAGYPNPVPVTVVPTAVDDLLNRLTLGYDAGKCEIRNLVNNLFNGCTCT